MIGPLPGGPRGAPGNEAGPKRRTVIAALLAGAAAAGLGGHVYRLRRSAAPHDGIPGPDAPAVFIDGWEILVLDADNADLLVIDPISETPKALFPIGGHPTGIVHAAGSLSVIVGDAAMRRLTVMTRRGDLRTRVFQLDIEPVFVALSPDGGRIAAIDWAEGDLLLLCADTGREIRRKRGYDGAHGLLFDRRGRTLLIPRRDAPEISRVDARGLEPLKPIRLAGDDGISRLIPMPGSDLALSLPLAGDDQLLSFVDLEGGDPIGTLRPPGPVMTAVADRRYGKFHASSAWEPAIYRLAPGGGIERRHHGAQGSFDALSVGSYGRALFALNGETGTLRILDATDYSVLRSHATAGAGGMFCHPWTNKAFVTLPEHRSVAVFDGLPESNDKTQGRLLTLNAFVPTAIAGHDGAGFCHV